MLGMSPHQIVLETFRRFIAQSTMEPQTHLRYFCLKRVLVVRVGAWNLPDHHESYFFTVVISLMCLCVSVGWLVVYYDDRFRSEATARSFDVHMAIA